MYTGRIFKVKPLLKSTSKIILRIATWAAIVVYLYEYMGIKWLKIPWVPMTLVGTAVAFYLGFKNNSICPYLGSPEDMGRYSQPKSELGYFSKRFYY